MTEETFFVIKYGYFFMWKLQPHLKKVTPFFPQWYPLQKKILFYSTE